MSFGDTFCGAFSFARLGFTQVHFIKTHFEAKLFLFSSRYRDFLFAPDDIPNFVLTPKENQVSIL
jgi:hypothetical protein